VPSISSCYAHRLRCRRVCHLRGDTHGKGNCNVETSSSPLGDTVPSQEFGWVLRTFVCAAGAEGERQVRGRDCVALSRATEPVFSPPPLADALASIRASAFGVSCTQLSSTLPEQSDEEFFEDPGCTCLHRVLGAATITGPKPEPRERHQH
jgi:hypothetical protein